MNKERSAGSSLPADRHSYIRQQLQLHGRVQAGELAATLGVSEDSIRRDLRELAASGVCQRVYGGAIALTPNQPSFRARKQEHQPRKARLAAAAVRQLQPGQFVFLDGGTTNLEIARALPEHLPLTVATNSIPIAAELFGKKQLELLLIGGGVNHQSGDALGAIATRMLQSMRPDICFLGTCSVDGELGIGTLQADEAAFKRQLVEQCGKTILAVTNEKLDTASPFLVAPLRDIGLLIIEPDADPARLAHLQASGVPVRAAD
ncbi:DeoR/GlpR family DNA-binding transcription regulator [Chromobacterium alticapitis]|uniref:DeoR/GlpR transcriptional regulator n=1 Tax=Chromobacterium alticapitis TaxID=2073169 RepID=A0A2S5DA67_9NEIS|nr:DeoR/GlpR family DNA-binding transcription regulator [Chromobacterium alticapitis]POZ59938.1 DeoR/GlpR transcriptional regulator [Chromobacterium alticapitis]